MPHQGLRSAMLAAWILLLPTLMAIRGLSGLDSLWGRPLTDLTVLAAYQSALLLPFAAWMIAGWLVRTQEPKPARWLIGRALWLVVTFGPLLWALLTLVAWCEAGPTLPIAALYGSIATSAAAFLALLAVIMRRPAVA